MIGVPLQDQCPVSPCKISSYNAEPTGCEAVVVPEMVVTETRLSSEFAGKTAFISVRELDNIVAELKEAAKNRAIQIIQEIIDKNEFNTSEKQ